MRANTLILHIDFIKIRKPVNVKVYLMAYSRLQIDVLENKVRIKCEQSIVASGTCSFFFFLLGTYLGG